MDYGLAVPTPRNIAGGGIIPADQVAVKLGADASQRPQVSEDSNERRLEPGIRTDLQGRLDYRGYLGLDRLLSAQHPRSRPEHHDEMLFIIQHQTSELWFKLIIHELRAAMRHLAADDAGPCMKILARIKQIQQQLFSQWAVLETLTPSEYVQFRDTLADASGFQSLQYRLVEFLLGNKNAAVLALFDHDGDAQAQLSAALDRPSLYDEFLRYLARDGHAVPTALIERDWRLPHRRNAQLVPVFVTIYRQPQRYWTAYALCERLVDVEESFQLWRFRHLKTVERIIGFKRGTGGSSGAQFLEQALKLTFFPELMDVRTEL